jgi:hypothetical protein
MAAPDAPIASPNMAEPMISDLDLDDGIAMLLVM